MIFQKFQSFSRRTSTIKQNKKPLGMQSHVTLLLFYGILRDLPKNLDERTQAPKKTKNRTFSWIKLNCSYEKSLDGVLFINFVGLCSASGIINDSVATVFMEILYTF